MRDQIESILAAALAAVEPGNAVRAHVQRRGAALAVAGQTLHLDQVQRVLVVGAGKAGGPMAAALEEVLGERISQGIVAVKHGHRAATRRVRLIEAGHPVPDAAGLQAAQLIGELADQAGPEDLVLCLLSGGGSALLPAPAPGLTLADLQSMTAALLRCGATIDEINTLRKHCSTLAGGQLARRIAPAQHITLILSDVVGSPLDVIASGPTVPDSSTFGDAWRVVERYELRGELPTAVVHHLQAGLSGSIAETPKPGDLAFARGRVVVVGDNAAAAQAAREAAAAAGFDALLLSTFVEGEAREVAKVAVALGREIAAFGRPVRPPACLILGGETTVTVRGTGAGGRNQELALAAALALQGREHITLVALATDGSDGPTDAAGGIVDGSTVARGAALGLSAAAYLQNNDAYPYLQATGALLVTGPTRTNVADLILVFVVSPA